MIINQANMLYKRTWSPKQAEILNCGEQIVCIDGGRRFGKSYISAPLFLKRRAQRHQRLIDQVRRGDRKPWAGGGQLPKHARHEEPDMECVILTPRERHQAQCRSYIMSYFAGKKGIFYHPGLKMIDSGREMWWYYGGVSCRLRFITGSGPESVVSNSVDLMWIDEAGLLDNIIVEAALPLTWERQGEVICSGTPEQGTDHWFTRRCLEGLDPSHDFYIPDIVEPDPNVKTFIGSSYEAFDEKVRAAAKRDAERLGGSWERKWVLGDWRLMDVVVYDNWDPTVHVIDYDYRDRKIPGRSRTLPPPSAVYGVIDFSYGPHRPGAAVVYQIWWHNPLEAQGHPRPLVIAVEDVQKAQEYIYDAQNETGWIYDLEQLTRRYGVQLWYCDPSRPEMVELVRRQARKIGSVVPASKADKWGRINGVKAWLEHTGGPPSFFVSKDGCKNLPRQFANYRRTTNAKGDIQDRTTDYDDHCLDCTAFLEGMVMPGGYSPMVLPA